MTESDGDTKGNASRRLSTIQGLHRHGAQTEHKVRRKGGKEGGVTTTNEGRKEGTRQIERRRERGSVTEDERKDGGGGRGKAAQHGYV